MSPYVEWKMIQRTEDGQRREHRPSATSLKAPFASACVHKYTMRQSASQDLLMTQTSEKHTPSRYQSWDYCWVCRKCHKVDVYVAELA